MFRFISTQWHTVSQQPALATTPSVSVYVFVSQIHQSSFSSLLSILSYMHYAAYLISVQTCTKIVLMMYRLCTEIASCISRIDMYWTRPHLYRNWDVPKSSTVCTESVMYWPYPMQGPGQSSMERMSCVSQEKPGRKPCCLGVGILLESRNLQTLE